MKASFFDTNEVELFFLLGDSMKLAPYCLTLAAIFYSCPSFADVIEFTDSDLRKAKGACLVGSGFDFITEADGSISIKNLEGKGKLHVGNKSVDVVDVPDLDKKKEFDDIRICIRGYLIKDQSNIPGKYTTDTDKLAKHPEELKNRTNSFVTQWQKVSSRDIENNNNTRLWKRKDNHWEESRLNGADVMYHDITKRISLNGCDGDRTVKENDKKLEMFIPDIDCKNMTLMFRFAANAWQTFGVMTNYK